MDEYFTPMSSFKIVLYTPEIPANTGNIGRLCLGANAELHIIKPMRFFINDQYLRRAGIDYWERVKLTIHDDWQSFLEQNHGGKIYLCSTKGRTLYSDVGFQKGDIFVFGPESRGLPGELLDEYQADVITIPMYHELRSINLCNSVAIVLYEGLRQVGFLMENEGIVNG